jgi:hypothetical protein
LIAGRLEPFGDLALGDGLAELRHQDVHGASVAQSSLPGLPRQSVGRFRMRSFCMAARVEPRHDEEQIFT